MPAHLLLLRARRSGRLRRCDEGSSPRCPIRASGSNCPGSDLKPIPPVLRRRGALDLAVRRHAGTSSCAPRATKRMRRSRPDRELPIAATPTAPGRSSSSPPPPPTSRAAPSCWTSAAMRWWRCSIRPTCDRSPPMCARWPMPRACAWTAIWPSGSPAPPGSTCGWRNRKSTSWRSISMPRRNRPNSRRTDDFDAIGASTEEDGFMPLVNAVLGGRGAQASGGIAAAARGFAEPGRPLLWRWSGALSNSRAFLPTCGRATTCNSS